MAKSRVKNINTVENLKEQYDCNTYFLFGIREEIDLQCPEIDDIIKLCEEVFDSLSVHIRKNPKDRHLASNMQTLNIIHRRLEERRRSIELLREFGKEWKQLAIRAIDDTGMPEKYLNMDFDINVDG